MTAAAEPVSVAPWPPMVVMVAPNGARLTKSDHPAIPLTAKEIAATAAACRDAGAAMLHLHVRDHAGGHLLDADAYRDAITAVRRAVGPDMIIQITTDSLGMYAPEEQMAVVREVHPEAVSLALKEIVPDPGHESAAAEFLAWLADEGTMVQFILYSPQGVTRFQELRRRGMVPGDQHFLLFVLGRYTLGQTSVPADLLPFLMVHDHRDAWALCAFGPRESACALTAAALGGHTRVGFENNVLLSDGSRAPNNKALVDQLIAGARLIGRPVADPATARSMFFEGSPTGSIEMPGQGRQSPRSPGLREAGAKRSVASPDH